MKKIKLFAVAALALILASCGGSSDSKSESTETTETQVQKIKPQATKINGFLGDCFEISDREYKIIGDGSRKEINIEISRKNAELPGIYDADAIKTILTIEFIDADGDIIYKTDSTDDSFLSLMPGDTGSISFFTYEDIKNATQFRISSDHEIEDLPQEESLSGMVDAVEELSDAYSTEDINNSLEQAEKAMDVAGDALKMMDGLMDAAKELEKLQK